MNRWQRWVKAPHTTLLHRVLFQVHLWLGIGLGLYILVISVSGSAVVLRPQFVRWFVVSEVASDEGEALAGAALENKVAEIYSEFSVINIVPPTRPRRASYVALEKDGVETSRYFDHFAGVDLGNTYPWQVRTVEWLTRLHDDLLLDRVTGRKINAFGGVLFLLMVITGIIIWWQGRRRWLDGLVIKRNSSHSFMWQLHSFLGFWSMLLLFVWGITAVYFAFPQPFDFIIDALDKDLEDFERPDKWLLFLIDLHFGRFRGSWLAYVWVVLGLLPAIMFISGFTLWYRKTLKKYM
ncbi:PepSY domain-containing protein [Gammaproteobacteria bacterium]|nr:PepSY domain-containing protein [Gammaproteobacteria bacterium]